MPKGELICEGCGRYESECICPEENEGLKQGQVEPKPETADDRLLSDEELSNVYVPKMVRSVDWVDLKEYSQNVAKAQLHEQATLERIKRKIESFLPNEWTKYNIFWQEFWEKELGGVK